MNYILTYDISNNRIRRKVSELLIDRGFVRVQRSVFIAVSYTHLTLPTTERV